ncbi:tetratricopeptide repeat-containing sensor histidine kinase [Flavobacterium wongokense]|uniref:tetratricopeptide repeat-containing sensor histidine kinase n=1 Tax=Flavobacterium wongokense TaxID=2910674 RepID=UPI001F360531|nr:histidine kinase [Flavobacterium sp. WG47]MCF6131705.1 histidine kinase [Flavobacterium sp. WG47]
MSKIKRINALLLFLLFFSASQAQDRNIDSLKVILRNPKVHDTVKLTAIGSLMDNKYTENNPKFYYLNNLIGALAQKNLKKKNNKILHETYTTWLATYYNVKAIDYGHKRESVKGLAALDKSIALYKSIKAYDDANYQLIVKGSFYSVVNENEKAISCVFTALKYFEKNKTEYTGEIAYATSILGNIYFTMADVKTALKYYKESVDYLSSSKTYVDAQNDYLKSVAYTSISSCYFSLKQFPPAVEYAEKALALAKKVGDNTHISLVLAKLGLAKMSLHQLDEAEALLKEGLALATNDRTAAQSYLALGRLYWERKDYAKTESYMNKALVIGKKAKDLKIQEQAYWLLYYVYFNSKHMAKASRMYELRYQLLDSIKTGKSKNILAQQQLKYDFEKKELNYKLETQQKNAAKNNWLIGLSGALLLVVLGGLFYYRNNKQRQAINVLEKNQMRQRLLISQMNPHFIFNSIQNIRSLINNKQDAAAVNYLDRFSKLTRQILENSNENYIALDEEIEMIENYLSIQQLLYNNKFEYTITVEDRIDAESVYLPPMLTQPFIENAIKHGLADSTENGLVSIRFYRVGSQLFFEVSDNGKGFDVNGNNSSHKSLAMRITRERLSHYTKKSDFTIHTTNVKDANGTVIGAQVNFEIPYIYEN